MAAAGGAGAGVGAAGGVGVATAAGAGVGSGGRTGSVVALAVAGAPAGGSSARENRALRPTAKIDTSEATLCMRRTEHQSEVGCKARESRSHAAPPLPCRSRKGSVTFKFTL